MLPLGARNVWRGLREGDHSRSVAGTLMLLFVFYRYARRRASLIARYEVREGDDLTIRLPKERKIDAKALEAALLAAGVSAPTDLDDDLLAAAPTEHESEDRQQDDTGEH